MNALLRLATIATSALIAGSAAADTVKVGLIADFTGGMAVYGSQFQHAIEAYQAVNGKTVKGPEARTRSRIHLSRPQRRRPTRRSNSPRISCCAKK